jgi:hypothetical protein
MSPRFSCVKWAWENLRDFDNLTCFPARAGLQQVACFEAATLKFLR